MSRGQVNYEISLEVQHPFRNLAVIPNNTVIEAVKKGVHAQNERTHITVSCQGHSVQLKNAILGHYAM